MTSGFALFRAAYGPGPEPTLSCIKQNEVGWLTWVKSQRAHWGSLPDIDIRSQPMEAALRAHQIMTRPVITVTPETSIVEAANIMLQRHISGLPVVNSAGHLVGIISEGDFIRRSEIGTQRQRGRFMKFILGAGKEATDFVHEHGRKIAEIMTPEPLTIDEETDIEKIVEIMEKNNVKRLPVTRGDKLVGIVSRSNLLQAVASLARQIPDPTADDDHIRNRIIAALEKNNWCPFGLSVMVRDGVVHLSGVITEERSRQAAIVGAENVAGVKKVHDHLCWVDTMSGMYLNSPEDDNLEKAS
jgi:CBS domain-containing protein